MFKVGDLVKIVKINGIGIGSPRHYKSLEELINTYGRIKKVIKEDSIDGLTKYSVKTKIIDINSSSGNTTLFSDEIELVTKEAEKQFVKITMDWL